MPKYLPITPADKFKKTHPMLYYILSALIGASGLEGIKHYIPTTENAPTTSGVEKRLIHIESDVRVMNVELDILLHLNGVGTSRDGQRWSFDTNAFNQKKTNRFAFSSLRENR